MSYFGGFNGGTTPQPKTGACTTGQFSDLGPCSSCAEDSCCAEASAPHRETVLSDSSYVTPETFGVDWVRAVDGVVYRGDGKRSSDWAGDTSLSGAARRTGAGRSGGTWVCQGPSLHLIGKTA